MNKPLTVEQLKVLKEGDWVWLIDKEENAGVYARKCELVDTDEADNREVFCYQGNHLFVYEYFNYNHKWIAYKNKEEAEAACEENKIEKINEIIKRVLQELFDKAREQGKHPINTPVDWIANCKELAKKYGVEVN